MTTVADLISLALLDSGVVGQGQTASAEDTTNALRRLNFMLSQWQRKRWLVYHLIDVSFVSTGAQSYTIGAGANFNTPRPDRLEAAFFRQLTGSGTQQIDYPLRLIQSREDYNAIALKTMGTWPEAIFYDSAYPVGLVYVWPVPAASLYAIHLSLKQPLTQFATLTETINLPPEYEAALHYNLCARLRPAYQMGPDPSITALAVESLNVIRNANTQLATLRMPGAVLGTRRQYNVYSDN